MRYRLLRLTLAMLALTLLYIGPAQSQDNKDKATAQPAYVRVLLPRADAKLSIDDTATRQFGENRLFVSPPLEPGKRYKYKLVAVWAPNNYTTITRTRSVVVESGKEAQVDMRGKDESQPDNIIVRYVPTPEAVVDKMLEMAKVGKEDVVYDLGCGDGRLVVNAVKKFGARRGVGLDYDPERIKDSHATAKASDVEDKVSFKQANVLHIKDYSDASVVTLYMGQDLNEAVRPFLWSTLKPGSRVVSHRFTMGKDFPSDQSIVFKHGGEEYKLHLWTIPAKKDDDKKDDKKD